ncbi:hypothetical protein [Flavobacterium cerinum]|uniref:Uncharacterized protein n=1 Tax=Flavobacterium cerinum TaxID=2502784 RepID=A0A3S3S768_9FLAO|nr:hypothetical protein [Flavobacterium cerinum]RWW91842.1 hypothetical protein EPI11_17525 [Flavobacterium cerinum]
MRPENVFTEPFFKDENFMLEVVNNMNIDYTRFGHDVELQNNGLPLVFAINYEENEVLLSQLIKDLNAYDKYYRNIFYSEAYDIEKQTLCLCGLFFCFTEIHERQAFYHSGDMQFYSYPPNGGY